MMLNGWSILLTIAENLANADVPNPALQFEQQERLPPQNSRERGAKSARWDKLLTSETKGCNHYFVECGAALPAK
jgi:hypothetical protein